MTEPSQRAKEIVAAFQLAVAKMPGYVVATTGPELLAFIAELEADRVRLDWLASAECLHKNVRWAMEEDDFGWCNSDDTLRDAIDAAMSAPKEQVPQ